MIQFNHKPCKTSTPWGTADSVARVVRGLSFYSTPSHGGYKLGKAASSQIPEVFRNENGWYEEDCESAIVHYYLAQFFEMTEFEIEGAASMLREFYPHQWRMVTGEIVTPEQSHVIREEDFNKANFGNWVACAAWGSHPSVPNGSVGVCARRIGEEGRRSIEERWVLVPNSAYEARNGFGYIVQGSDESWVNHP